MIGKKVYPKIIIDDVTFDGLVDLPPAFKDELTRKMLQRDFDGDSRWLDDLAEGSVRGVLEDHGYFKAHVTAEGIPRGGDSDYRHVSAIFHVVEGLQYRLGAVNFRSADPDEPLAFAPEELRRLFSLEEGDILNVDKIRESLDALKALYGEHGYIDFVAAPLTEVDDSNQRVSITMELEQEKQFRIGKVEVLGLGPQLERLLDSSIKPGAVFNQQLIKDFLRDNKSVLPELASPEEIVIRRDVKKGTVDLRFAFQD